MSGTPPGCGEDFPRALYDEHAAVLAVYVQRLVLGDRRLAEDIVQETLVRAWKHAGRIPAGGLRPWLFVTARHLVIDTARSRRARPVEVGPALIEVAAEDDGLDAALGAVLLADAPAALRVAHRQVLFDAYYRGQTAAQIADDRGEQHLVGCHECLEELGELAFTASLLALVQPEDAAMLDGPDPTASASPPSALPSGRPGPGRNGNHVRRRAGMAAAATVVMGTAAVPAVHLLGRHEGTPQAVVLRAAGPAPRVRAEVSMVARDGGTGLRLTLAGAPKNGGCSLVARATDASSEIAATWPADGFGRVDVSGRTAIPAAQLSELSVVTDTGRRLVSIPVPHMSS